MSVEPGRVHETHDRGCTLPSAQASREEPVRASDGDRTNLVLDSIVVARNVAIGEVARQRWPAAAAVVDGLRDRGAIGLVL